MKTIIFLCWTLIFSATYSQQITRVDIGGRPPATYRAPEYIPNEANGDVYLQNVPIYDWSYGCSNTSAAMLVGYYDWHGYIHMYDGPSGSEFVALNNSTWWGSGHCPLSASQIGLDNRLENGHVEDYYVNYGSTDTDPFITNNWIEHTYGECTGDFMGTSQNYWDNIDGSTTFYFWENGDALYDFTDCEFYINPRKDGCHGLREFIEARGYNVLSNYSQYICVSGNWAFSFANYKNEIDNNRPVLIHVTDHTMLGVGYNITDNTVILHDTWDNTTHTMTWGGSYYDLNHFGVTVIQLQDPPPGGVDDYVEFINNPPTQLELNNLYEYEAQFISVYGNSNPVWWESSVVLYHDNGEYQLFYEHLETTYPNNSFEFNTPVNLPQYNWIRNENGNVKGYAKVEVEDSDGYGHYDQLEIEFLVGPPVPQICGGFFENGELYLSYYTQGAEGYEIYYDNNSGPPYNGYGALQGSSPINAGEFTTFGISGLQFCTPYYFAVKAYDLDGYSDYSYEKEIIIFNPNIPGKLIYHFDDLEINSDLDWANENRYFKGDIIISSGVTLTVENGVLYLDEESKIIIEPGGKLILNNTTCTNACGNHWAGIEVWGNKFKSQHLEDGQFYQGQLILNGAVIENAKSAVELWKPNDYNSTGGIVQAENTVFRNNAKSVHALLYNNYNPYVPSHPAMDNISFFKICTFEITNEYIPIPGYDFYKHVDLNKVKGINFLACDFSVVETPGVNTWNLAISSYCAGFYVKPICNSQQLPCDDYDKCTFNGFQCGIYAFNDGSNTNTFYVNEAEFTNNSYGISMNAVHRATVLSSDFYLGFNAAEDEKCDGKSAAYGIDLTGCTGFAIEENTFTKATGAPPGNYIGVRTTDCKTTSELYLNEYSGISIGNMAVGNNRPQNSYFGVTYLCNENANNNYDFHVSGSNSTITSFVGWYDNPSGNKLSSDAIVQFQNDNIYSTIQYFYNMNEPDEELTLYSTAVWPYPVDDENTCPSHYGGGGTGGRIDLSDEEKQAKEAEFLQNYNNYSNVEALYNSLLDGGSTDALKTEVELSWPQDMWELRAELLGKSPHLSKEVLMTAADKTNVLPESVIFEVMAANPDELKKEELIKYLEDKANPLPTYMIDILRQVANGTSYKTVLLSEMSKYHHKKIAAAQDIIRSILSKEEPDLAELRNWLDNIGGLESDKQIVATYLQEGNYSSAQSMLDMIPSYYQLSGDEPAEFNDYKNLQQILIQLSQENRTVSDLTAAELNLIQNLADNSSGAAQTIAQGILQYAYGEVYCNCPDLPEDIQLKSSSTEIDRDKLAKAMGLEISAEPNPSKTWTALNYTLPLAESKGIIEITEPSGRVVQTIEVTQTEGQHVLDTRNYKPGVYLYTINCGEFKRSGKLIVR